MHLPLLWRSLRDSNKRHRIQSWTWQISRCASTTSAIKRGIQQEDSNSRKFGWAPGRVAVHGGHEPPYRTRRDRETLKSKGYSGGRISKLPLSALNVAQNGTGLRDRRKMSIRPSPSEESAHNRSYDSFRSRKLTQATEIHGRPNLARRASGAQHVPNAPGQGFFRVLLNNVKSVCKSVRAIRERHASGEDISELVRDTVETLGRINEAIASGTSKKSGSPGEVAALFHKLADTDSFVQGRPQNEDHGVIVQSRDGTFSLVVRTNSFPRSDSSANSGSERRMDRISHTSSRTESTVESNYTDTKRSSLGSKSDKVYESDVPEAVPYTTAASQFLYGYNSVLAALKARRRKLYYLYVHPKVFQRENQHQSNSSEKRNTIARPAHDVVRLAKESNTPFRNEFRTKLLEQMSEGRPHNGLILEASRLPAPPVLSVGNPSRRTSEIPLTLGSQNAEEAAVNGTPASIKCASDTWRYPLIVMLDGILDPANVGNIVRTCHFYGVDGVAVATNTCATLSSPVLAKASSGACEAVRFLALPKPSEFVFESAKMGWKILAAVAPVPGQSGNTMTLSTSEIAAESPLATYPCILMLGAEGEGLRESLRRRADTLVCIERANGPQDVPDVGVDSMNVGSAAGVLLESLLRKPAGAHEKRNTAGTLGW